MDRKSPKTNGESNTQQTRTPKETHTLRKEEKKNRKISIKTGTKKENNQSSQLKKKPTCENEY